MVAGGGSGRWGDIAAGCRVERAVVLNERVVSGVGGRDVDPRGLHGGWTRFQRHAGAAPSADLAGYVERYWVVHWHYDPPYRQVVVPYPNVHLTFSRTGATITGPTLGHQVRILDGVGGAL